MSEITAPEELPGRLGRADLWIEPRASILVLSRVVGDLGEVSIGRAPDGSVGYLVSTYDEVAVHWMQKTLTWLGIRANTIKEGNADDTAR